MSNIHCLLARWHLENARTFSSCRLLKELAEGVCILTRLFIQGMEWQLFKCDPQLKVKFPILLSNALLQLHGTNLALFTKNAFPLAGVGSTGYYLFFLAQFHS